MKEREMRKKNKQKREGKWKEMSDGLMGITGMEEWIERNPTSTLEEIEEALDERILELRAQMLEDVIMRISQQEDWKGVSKEERPKCERCGVALIARGKRTRILQTSGGQEVKIERSYGSCPDCGQGFFFLMNV
jgi:ribosomal protein S27AE